MTTFAIDSDNNITAYSEKPPVLTGLDLFTSEKQLAKLSATWSAARFADTWNSFAATVPFDDLRPVKKFTNRKVAVGRIWRAVQRLTPVVGPQLAPDATEAHSCGECSSVDVGLVSTGQGSKKALVLEMLRRPAGATLNEIMTATGWQAHTVRGHISGTVTKKLGFTVESLRDGFNQRRYRIDPLAGSVSAEPAAGQPDERPVRKG